MLKHIDEYRDPKLAKKLLDKILSSRIDRRLNFMEVCGTHTMSISRFGLRKLLQKKINLISGPGCPVCVTTSDYIDRAIVYSRSSKNIITTFGDMFRVPGSSSSLEIEKSKGADIRIVYSPSDSIKIAQNNRSKRVIFLSVGFETTVPTTAGMLRQAQSSGVDNLFILSSNKLIPPALDALLSDPEAKIDGFILPAHVSTLIGYAPYEFIVKERKIPSVITGFEALDILAGVEMLFTQNIGGKAELQNEYARFARPEGNPRAMSLVHEIFETCDATWRGFGTIPKSGLNLKEGYSNFDIERIEPLRVKPAGEPKGCLCSKVIKGIKKPTDCKLFGRSCTPSNPIGACMVSSEGSCAAYYRYERV